MTDALVPDMPMELDLELVPSIGSNSFDAEGELADDVVDDAGLGVMLLDLESPDAGCIINGGVLVTFDQLVVFTLE